jgi:CHASE3 domain sensor protein
MSEQNERVVIAATLVLGANGEPQTQTLLVNGEDVNAPFAIITPDGQYVSAIRQTRELRAIALLASNLGQQLTNGAVEVVERLLADALKRLEVSPQAAEAEEELTSE